MGMWPSHIQPRNNRKLLNKKQPAISATCSSNFTTAGILGVANDNHKKEDISCHIYLIKLGVWRVQIIRVDCSKIKTRLDIEPS